MRILLNCLQNPDWLPLARQALSYQGLVALQGLLSPQVLADTRAALWSARQAYHDELGPQRLSSARANGDVAIRLPIKYHPQFLYLLEHPALLAVLDACLGGDAILRMVNGSVQPPVSDEITVSPYEQGTFHMNFKQVLNGYPAALDLIVVADAGPAGAAFEVVPGSHQRMNVPSAEYQAWAAEFLRLPTGTLVVMDPTLWHRECVNRDSNPWISVHYQFVQPFIKPHIDYLRALGPEVCAALPARTQRLLGVQAQVPTNLDEFYQPGPARLYQAPWLIGMKQQGDDDPGTHA